MEFPGSPHFVGLCVALGLGLLIGAERERRKGQGPDRNAAGIRTFTVAALTGAVAALIGDALITAFIVLLLGAFALVAYTRTRSADPGLTTEIALLLTCLLGALAISEPLLAAAIGSVLAGLLAAKQRIHGFVSQVLTERELHDVIVFAAFALIVLPLAPDRHLGPYQAINPSLLARMVLLVMVVNALGYVARRMLGVRFGLPVTGLVSGFVSSTATIHAMGSLAKSRPETFHSAVSAAMLSNVATLLQLALVLAALEIRLLNRLWLSIGLGCAAAVIYAGWLMWRSRSVPAVSVPQTDEGHAFDLKAGLTLALLVGVVSVVAAALNAWLGAQGLFVSSVVAGLLDAHAAATSVASLVKAGQLPLEQGVLPVVAGFAGNTLFKGVLAARSGGRAFALKIVPGLAFMLGGVLTGVLLMPGQA